MTYINSPVCDTITDVEDLDDVISHATVTSIENVECISTSEYPNVVKIEILRKIYYSYNEVMDTLEYHIEKLKNEESHDYH